MRVTANLFDALNNWATAQDENFVTETFAYALRFLCRSDRTAALAVLTLLMPKDPPLTQNDVPGIVLIPRPHTTTAEGLGYPDIQLRLDHAHLTYLEAKVKEECREPQFKTYIQALVERTAMYGGVNLVYVTRHRADDYIRDRNGIRVHNVLWRELCEVLDKQYAKRDRPFLVEQFCEYLRGKGATLKDLEHDLRNGHGIVPIDRDGKC
jgi:hypothetical protein